MKLIRATSATRIGAAESKKSGRDIEYAGIDIGRIYRHGDYYTISVEISFDGYSICGIRIEIHRRT